MSAAVAIERLTKIYGSFVAVSELSLDVGPGEIFARVRPRLVVFSHGGGPESLPLVRQHYDGPVEIGEDMMTIDVGDSVTVQRFAAGPR